MLENYNIIIAGLFGGKWGRESDQGPPVNSREAAYGEFVDRGKIRNIMLPHDGDWGNTFLTIVQ